MEAKWQYDSIPPTLNSVRTARRGCGQQQCCCFIDAQTGNALSQSINDYLEGGGFVSVTSLAMDGSGRYLCVGTNSGQVLLT